MRKLTDVAIRAWIRSGERFEGLSDGDGLVLTWREKHTAPSWRLRYRFSGKPRVMEIGSYSDLTLATARQAAKELRAKIALGHDVAGEKQERKSSTLARIEAARSVTTVGQLADEYFERVINGRWKHPHIVRSRIEKDIKPHLGKLTLDAVEPRHIDVFPCTRTLEGFDFQAQPSVDARAIKELALGRWIANGDALLLLGPPGVGKTHLAVALGREAIARGYSTLFTSATALVTALSKAHLEGRLDERIAHYAKPKLLIVDELGYLPFEPNAAHLFFTLVSKRYERGAMLLTSNRAVSEWGTVFGDPVVATATLDRLLHHSQVITIRGDSYRLRAKRRSGLLQQAAAQTPQPVQP